MSIITTVNSVLDGLPGLDGEPVQVEGLLVFDAEEACLRHLPKAERRTSFKGDESAYASSIWRAFGSGSLQSNPKMLSQWNGRRVRVSGVLHAPGMWGCGANGLWPAELEPYSIERVLTSERNSFTAKYRE